jgi:ParB-like chromosome segregation protein Spo0J
MEGIIKKLTEKLSVMEDDEKVEALNKIKLALHEISPLKNEPVDCVIWVKIETIIANDYNPNSVAPPEMELLRTSIGNDGYTQPVVTFPENGNYTVVDGFHRTRVCREIEEINNRVNGYLPITIIRDSQEDRGDRIASTIRHNRARGKHKIDAMSDIVIELKRRNWSDKKISKQLGMDQDEVLRLCQITGLAEMFEDKDFSEAWEAEISNTINEDDNLIIDEEKN